MRNIFKLTSLKNLWPLLLSIFIAEGTGALSGFLSMNTTTSYQSFNKPSFSPPGYIFPIVWIILFFLMAVAAYRIWLKGKSSSNLKKALTLYAIQLILNFFWSIIFFRFNLMGLAFIELLLLLVFILLTTFEFYKHDKIAAYLMVPYILWVSFAAVLNYTIWMIN